MEFITLWSQDKGNLATTRWTKPYLSGISNKPTWVQPRSYPEGLRWLGATFKTGPSPLGSRGTYQRPKPYLVLSGNQPSRHPVSRRNARSPPPPQGPHMPDDSCLSGTCARPDHCGKIRHFWESNPRPRDWRRKPGPLDQVTPPELLKSCSFALITNLGLAWSRQEP